VRTDNHHLYENSVMARKIKAEEKRVKRQSRTTEKPNAGTVGAKDRTQGQILRPSKNRDFEPALTIIARATFPSSFHN
jgi:hypothetical protein